MPMHNPHDLNVFWNQPLAHANPAAGANFSYIIPTGQQTVMISFLVSFQADGNAANRIFTLGITDGVNAKYKVIVRDPLTAGQSATMSFGAGLGAPSYAAGVFPAVQSWPVGYMIPAGQRIEFTAAGIQVGDQMSGIVTTFHNFVDPNV